MLSSGDWRRPRTDCSPRSTHCPTVVPPAPCFPDCCDPQLSHQALQGMAPVKDACPACLLPIGRERGASRLRGLCPVCALSSGEEGHCFCLSPGPTLMPCSRMRMEACGPMDPTQPSVSPCLMGRWGIAAMWVSVFLRSLSVWVSVCMKWNKLAHRQPLFQILYL